MNKTINLLESNVSKVTVYTDRALVTRTATLFAPAGTEQYLFDELPNNIDQNSIQVNGAGGAVLSNIKFNEVYYDVIPNEHLLELVNKRQEFEDKITVINDQISQSHNEKTFIEDIAKKMTSNSKKSSDDTFDPDKWVKMVDFYSSKMSTLDKEIRNAQISLRDIENKYEKIDNEINNLGDEEKKRNQVSLTLELAKETEITLELSYIVYGPSWTPNYDLRVDTEKESLNITYKASVIQATSESWDDVQLSLSTAQPKICGYQPELSPWHLLMNEPYTAIKDNSRENMKKERKKSGMQLSRSESAIEEMLEDKLMQAASAPLETRDSTIESQATSVVFNIEGLSSVGNDGDNNNVTIMKDDLPATFRYSCVPKLSAYAYLKARTENTSEYPFLAGGTNIFLDNNFVATSYLDLVAPTETFWTSLGIDEGMKVEHKFLKRQQKENGVFKKSNHFEYDYQIDITNNKTATHEIVVWDQLPISNHEKIEVKLLQPDMKVPQDNFKMDEYDYLAWTYKAEPGQKIQIPFKFSIEYPQDMSISGL